MISTKRRIIVIAMKESKKEYKHYSVQNLTDFIKMEYKCTHYIARLCAQDLINN
jgi:hypothetical protein